MIALTSIYREPEAATILYHLLRERTPANARSIKFFEKHGARLIQNTYEMP